MNRLRLLLAFAALLPAAGPAAAGPETFACPALTGAVQVEPCPTEEQLRYTFIGFCSDNRRMYEGDGEVCASFDNYRRRKNVALWEAGEGGGFQGYLSCELPRERLLGAAARTVEVSRRGSLTRVNCRYDDGITLVLRTKAPCSVVGDARCASDGSGCRVRCD